MARITLASLTARIAALEAQLLVANEVCADQRSQLAIANEVFGQACATVAERDDTIARLEATCAAQATRLDNAVAYFKAQRAAPVATPVVVAPQPKAVPVPTATRYYDAKGALWERTRYSSTRSICRPVATFVAAETFSDADDFADADAI